MYLLYNKLQHKITTNRKCPFVLQWNRIHSHEDCPKWEQIVNRYRWNAWQSSINKLPNKYMYFYNIILNDITVQCWCRLGNTCRWSSHTSLPLWYTNCITVPAKWHLSISNTRHLYYDGTSGKLLLILIHVFPCTLHFT